MDDGQKYKKPVSTVDGTEVFLFFSFLCKIKITNGKKELLKGGKNGKRTNRKAGRKIYEKAV